MKISALLKLLLGTTLFLAPSPAATVSFYAGLDDLQTLTSGPYTGLANPNLGRLTMLLNHGDHFHSIGAYSYTGPIASPTAIPTSTNNRIPEISSGEDPLPLSPGSGLYAGSLVNHPGASEYSDIVFNSIHQLDDFGPADPETILLHSSGGRWDSSIAGAQIALELLSITPGLNVGTLSDTNIFPGPMSNYVLGGGSGFEFTPVFWTAKGALPGTYSATMRLVDLSATPSTALPSGEFSFDFAVATPVPEPSAAVLVGIGLVAFVYSRARRRSQK